MPDSSTPAATNPRARARWNLSPVRPGGLAVFAAAAVLVGLGFAYYTGQIWEDTLITLKYAENLVRGQGLVYNSGERVQGFTSPLNVLVLALSDWLTGGSSYVATVWMYRVFTIAAFAGGGVLVLRTAGREATRWTPAIWFLALFYLFEPKAVAYSANGMETGFMMLFVGWAVSLLTLAAADPWRARGLCWAGLMWSRPDGCVYIAALILAELGFFRDRPWRDALKSFARSAGLCTLAYGPWFFWTWWYYGSPIPHTVIAKANVEAGMLGQFRDLLENFPENLFVTAGRSFRPIQFNAADTWIVPTFWGHLIFLLSKALGGFALLYWLLPVPDRLGRAASFCFAILCGYFSFQLLAYLWYYPPALIFAMVALARALTMIAVGIRRAGAIVRRMNATALAIVAVLSVGQMALFAVNTRAEMIWQKEIEDGQRRKIGSWLQAHGRPDQTVYLEPLGYIGYFSRMKMIDHPGLISPEVVRLRQEKHVDVGGAVEFLRPDWLVLRKWEADGIAQTPYGNQFVRDYRLVQVFDVNGKIDAYGQIAADASIRYDAIFGVFQRDGPNGAPAGGAGR